jgi:ABC-type spermidine/putrescine transport system permease subunit I
MSIVYGVLTGIITVVLSYLIALLHRRGCDASAVALFILALYIPITICCMLAIKLSGGLCE